MTAERVRARVRLLLLPALAAVMAACGGSGSSQTDSNAFVFLLVERFSVSGTAPAGSVNSALEDDQNATVVCATLVSNAKNPTVTTSTALDTVVIRSYTVTFSGSDSVPGPFRFDTSVVVPAPGQAGGRVTFPVILVPAGAKREGPLRPFPRTPMVTSAVVVFRGEDGRGQSVRAEGGLTVVFVVSGDDVQPTCG